jgi:hypothetical protein
MDAIFIRHNMSSTPEILNELWSKRLIAVHFKDNWSTKPEDYDGAGKKALSRLWRYCESGAIVGADFKSIRPTSMLVGEIEPKSKVEVEKFGDYIYKIVQLKNTEEIFYQDYPLLAAIQPRQTTITGWPSAQKYMEAILGKGKIPWDVGSLHPNQLEVICYEYLRREKILDVLLMPIGRTLRDIDIFGIKGQGKYILAQVTYSTDFTEISEKIKKLKSYKSKDSLLFFFGPKSQDINDYEDVEYISIEKVFDLFTSDSKSVYYEMIHKMLKCKMV